MKRELRIAEGLNGGWALYARSGAGKPEISVGYYADREALKADLVAAIDSAVLPAPPQGELFERATRALSPPLPSSAKSPAIARKTAAAGVKPRASRKRPAKTGPAR